MLLLICLSALLALVAADGYYYESPAALHWNSLAPTHQYQYHTQDGFGQYSYGYGEPLSRKQEVRTLDGITRGSYTYLDGAGKLQTVAYTADANGFRVTASNLPKAPLPTDATTTTTTTIDVPQPVQDTPEVTAARIQHLAAHQQAKLRLYQIPRPTVATPTPAAGASTISTIVKKVSESDDAEAKKRIERVDQILLPQSVVDTPEVAAAKAEFFKRYEEVKQRNEKLRQQQEQIAGYALVKSQPLTVSGPISSYKPAFAPNGILRYGLVVPPNSPEYLPVSKFNF